MIVAAVAPPGILRSSYFLDMQKNGIFVAEALVFSSRSDQLSSCTSLLVAALGSKVVLGENWFKCLGVLSLAYVGGGFSKASLASGEP